MTLTVPGLPTNYQGCRVVGHFIYTDGTPVAGAKFTLTPSANNIRDIGSIPKVTILGRTINGTLSPTGAIMGIDGTATDEGIIIAASDDPDVNPTDFTYTFSFTDGQLSRAYPAYPFPAPYNTTVDLADEAPLVDPDGTIIVRGPTGPTGVTPDLTVGTVSAVPYGTAPGAVITGTPENPVLNLVLETGPTDFQGTWNGEHSYLAGQIVTDADALWLATADNSGIEPSLAALPTTLAQVDGSNSAVNQPFLQRFTPTEDLTVNEVATFGCPPANGGPGPAPGIAYALTLTLAEQVDVGLPPVALASGTTAGAQTGVWNTVTLNTPVTLLAGTQYSLLAGPNEACASGSSTVTGPVTVENAFHYGGATFGSASPSNQMKLRLLLLAPTWAPIAPIGEPAAAAEAAARAAAIAGLSTVYAPVTEPLAVAEATARAAAISALATVYAPVSEVAARSSAISGLATVYAPITEPAAAAEATARTAAVAAEVAARTSAVNALATVYAPITEPAAAAEATARASAIATLSGTYAPLANVFTDVAGTVTAAGALVVGKHNPVNATAGNLTLTLANAAKSGLVTTVEKTDSTTNTVTVTGNFRGATTSIALVWAHETVEFLSASDGSWWPIAGHKTKGSLDAAYAVTGEYLFTSYITGTPDLTGGTDYTAQLNTCLAAMYAAGGGTLKFPAGRLLFAGKITLPNNGGLIPPPTQPAITWKGVGGYYNGQNSVGSGGTRLIFTYQGAGTTNDAKIITRGLGVFRCEGIVFQDTTAASSTPFLYTTLTTLKVSDCAFLGATLGTTCAQDAIILGGTTKYPVNPTSGNGYGDPDAPFQGYGTVISGCYFTGIRRVVYGRSFCNQVVVRDNFFDKGCGSNLAGGACIELDGSLTATMPGDYVTSNVITGNYFENVGYVYSIKLIKATQTHVAFNGSEDPGANFVAFVRYEGTTVSAVNYPSTGNLLVGNFTGGYPSVSADALSSAVGANNSLIAGVTTTEGTVFADKVTLSSNLALPNPTVSSFLLADTSGTALLTISGSGRQWNIKGSLYIDGNAAGAGSTYLTVGGGAGGTASDAIININPPSGQAGQIQYKRAGVNSWLLYDANSTSLFLRDSVSGVMALTFNPGTGVSGSIATGGALKVAGNVGFYGTNPVAKATGTPAGATDLPSVIALANALRTTILGVGLAA